MTFWFIVIFTALLASIVWLDVKFHMLRDASLATPRPYSFARVQLAWWTLIVLASFITILIQCDVAPTLHQSTLILLGISAATTTSARVIDVSDQEKPNVVRHQDRPGQNFFLDILSDENGVSIQRFQTVVFNITFGVWFIAQVVSRPDGTDVNAIMPIIGDNNLILIGLSNGTYAGLKATENKPKPAADADGQPELVPNEANNNAQPAEG